MENTYSKLFKCSVHGTIRVSSMALKIIDSIEFQRLRSIKQLSLCYLVFPSAVHTRFEHSLGVYHLTGVLLDRIRKLYPNKEYYINEFKKNIVLNDFYAELIMIAGLCHDIGHGPFSHTFDNHFVGHIDHPNKCHEIRSGLIIEKIIKRELPDVLTDEHISFIKALIHPEYSCKNCALYNIVSNANNGIDVDKMDYLSRDTKTLGMNRGIDIMRMLNEIIIDENENICFPKHCSSDILDLFHTRYMMHKQIYNHKTVKILEIMLYDIFRLIDPIFKFSETIYDMDKFCRITDNSFIFAINSIINPPPFISISLTPNQIAAITEANKIFTKISSRKLYKSILDSMDQSSLEKIELFFKKHPDLNRTDFEIIKCTFGYHTCKSNDPFSFIYFYDKKEEGKSFTMTKNQVTSILNDNYQETHIHLICRHIYLVGRVRHLWKDFINNV